MAESIKNLVNKAILEALQLRKDMQNNRLVVVSDLQDAHKASYETFRNKNTLSQSGFKWDNPVRGAWSIDIEQFEHAKKVLEGINKKELLIQKIEDIEEFVAKSDAPDKNNLADRIKLFVDDLANATDEAAADAKIKQYLNFFSKFRKHSFTNSFLIFIQKPDATKVAGFRQWEEKFHRRVKKGAKGIMIFAPLIVKTNNGDGDADLDKAAQEKVVRGFKAVYVFDISDTEAIDERGNAPEEPKWHGTYEASETAEKLFDYVTKVADMLGIKLTFDDSNRGEEGYSRGDHINLSSHIAGVGRLSTMLHEMAHELMHWKKTSPFYVEDNLKANASKEAKELQAESVSYTVLRHYGIQVTHHATYLAMWKANKDKIKSNLEIIIKVSKFLIDKIDEVAEADIQNQANQNPA